MMANKITGVARRPAGQLDGSDSPSAALPADRVSSQRIGIVVLGLQAI
jgi:hypothetical protein